MTDTYWTEVDFRPAPPGWRLVHLDRDQTTRIEPMPGWLIEEEIELHRDETGSPTGSRRVVAGALDEHFVRPAVDASTFWYVLAPGEAEPTPEQVQDELQRRNAV